MSLADAAAVAPARSSSVPSQWPDTDRATGTPAGRETEVRLRTPANPLGAEVVNRADRYLTSVASQWTDSQSEQDGTIV